MANAFKNSVVNNVGTAQSKIIEVPDNARATVIGLSLANLTTSNLLVSVSIESNSVTGHYVKDVLLPANSTLKVLNGGEKLILASEDSLYVNSTEEDSIDVIASYVEIT
jgi:hypothetical protein